MFTKFNRGALDVQYLTFYILSCIRKNVFCFLLPYVQLKSD